MRRKILGLIAARSGSQGLQHKNIQPVLNQPLLVLAIRLAQAAQRANEDWQIVVSTDSSKYAQIAQNAGAQVPFLRPHKLATNQARLIDVVLHTLAAMKHEGSHFDSVVLLSATTPLTTASDVRRGLNLHFAKKTAVASVVVDAVPDAWRFSISHNTLKPKSTLTVGRRQIAPTTYHLNGAIYIATPLWLASHGRFVVPNKTAALVMPKERSLDIEDRYDLDLARILACRQMQ